MRTRLVLLSLLLCLSACKEGNPAADNAPPDTANPVGDTNKADGKVIDISGLVSATRVGAKARTLKLHDDIFANDTVRTAEHASVAIWLNKNGAIYDISDGLEVKIEDSLAWSIETKSPSVFDPGLPYEGTSVAGVNNENKAAMHGSEVQATNSPSPDPNITGGEATAAGDPGTSAQDPAVTTTGKKTDDSSDKGSNVPSEDPSDDPSGDPSLAEDELFTRQWSRLGQAKDVIVSNEEAGETDTRGQPWPTAQGAVTDSGSKYGEGGFALSGKAGTKGTKRAFVLALAKACQAKSSGSGILQLQITFADSKVGSLIMKGSPALAKTIECLKEKLFESTDAPKEGTVIFSLNLLPRK